MINVNCLAISGPFDTARGHNFIFIVLNKVQTFPKFWYALDFNNSFDLDHYNSYVKVDV